MISTLDESQLLNYVFNQLDTYFPDGYSVNKKQFENAMTKALLRLEKCFMNVKISGYHKDGEVYFSHLHSDQYTQFLYFFANTIWKDNLDEIICSKIMLLIRQISGMFVSYKCALPDVFVFYHATGSVIGNAKYSDYLVVFQNVTINTDKDENGNVAHELGKGLFLAAGSKIIGNKRIGDHVSLGVNAFIYNEEIKDNSVVISVDGKNVIKKRKNERCFAQNYSIL